MLAPYYSDLIIHLCDKKYKSSGLLLDEFKQRIGKLNSLFTWIKAGDSKDLFNFIIMQLHEELNFIKEEKKDDNSSKIPLNQTNEKLMLTNFGNYFMKNYNSRISLLFYANYKTEITCYNCGTNTYNIEIYFFLIFPLEKMRKFRSIFYRPSINSVNIYDCLSEYQNSSALEGYCNYCKCQMNLQFYILCQIIFEINEFVDLNYYVEYKKDVS